MLLLYVFAFILCVEGRPNNIDVPENGTLASTLWSCTESVKCDDNNQYYDGVVDKCCQCSDICQGINLLFCINNCGSYYFRESVFWKKVSGVLWDTDDHLASLEDKSTPPNNQLVSPNNQDEPVDRTASHLITPPPYVKYDSTVQLLLGITVFGSVCLVVVIFIIVSKKALYNFTRNKAGYTKLS